MLRLAILVVGVLNVIVVLTALRFLRRYVRLLLDVEQYAREARNRMERDMTTMARAMGSLEGEIAQLRQRAEGRSPTDGGKAVATPVPPAESAETRAPPPPASGT